MLPLFSFTLSLALTQAPIAKPFWADEFLLRHMAAVAHVPAAPALAVAWLESRDNLSAALRGHHCWHAAHDSVPARYAPDCEVGRFQIKPSTARARCPGLDVFTQQGNYVCFFWMFHQDVASLGVLGALARHRGGTAAQNAQYVRDAMKVAVFVAMTSVEALVPSCPEPRSVD